MNAHNCPPGTLLLASRPCPFCGSPFEIYRKTARSGIKGWTVACTGRNGTFTGAVRIPAVCDIKPTVWKPTREEAIAAISRRVK